MAVWSDIVFVSQNQHVSKSAHSDDSIRCILAKQEEMNVFEDNLV